MNFIFCQAAFAQLQWDKRDLEFHPGAADTNVVARFTFANAGSHPVTILAAKISCGSCAVAELDKKRYRPGERGALTATFDFGQRVGLQTKSIVVQTDDRSEPNAILTFKVHIPELVKITPTLVYWLPGEPRVAKTMTVKVVHDQPINILAIKSSNGRLTAKLKTMKSGSEYEIAVIPADTKQPATAVLQVETDYPRENPRTFNAHAMVKGSSRP
ncbi:MAG: DUF1573 domain-containing protein [Verrucomicrobiae bacterium]|nr:DUF1573 domain-containing protein [Verrucomicrobiae bacterium]